MAHLKAALVLTWDVRRARVLCPFNCDAKIHNHGCTLPRPGFVNSRAAHCVRGAGRVSSYELSHYRLVFPFELDPCTYDVWWEIDRDRRRWRTIGWGLDDPEYVEPEQTVSPPSNTQPAKLNKDRDEDLEQAFESLNLQQLEPNYEKELFDSYCVTNDVEAIREMLEESERPSALYDEVCFPGDKPILLATCEEGHKEMVDLLLEYKPFLEAEDENGETALTKAIQHGYGRIALALVEAGANMDVVDSDGASLLELARRSFKLQKRYRASELHPANEEFPARQSRLRKRELEISALESFIQQLEFREVKKCAERKRQKLVQLHGEEQARHFIETQTFDRPKKIARLLQKIFKTPRSGKTKTVASLIRGTALPYTFAVSGYSAGSYGYCDGALNRPTWVERVFQIATLINHPLPAHGCDEEGRTGSYFACHAEKQLLAFMLWNHTSLLISDPADRADLKQCEPPSLASLPINIVI